MGENNAAALLEKLTTELKSTQNQILEQSAKQDAEIKAIGGTSTETSKALKGLNERFDRISEDIRGEMKALEAKAAAAEERADKLEAKFARPGFDMPGQVKSWGRQLIESPEYKAWNPQTGGYCGVVKVGAWFDAAEKKDLLGSADGVRSVLSTDLVQTISAPPRFRRVHIRDYMNVVATSRAKIDYLVESGYTDATDAKTEGSAAGISDIDFDPQTETMKTIAAGLVITRELAADAPAMVTWTDRRIRQGLANKEDVQLIKGSGIGKFYRGVKNASGVQTFTRGRTGDNKLDNLRRAATQILLIEGAMPNMALMNPIYKEEIDLLKDSQERYLWLSVTNPDGSISPWRMDLVESTAMEQNDDFIVGDWANGVTLWDRQEGFVEIFNQHAEFALEGNLLLLGTMRGVPTWEVPEMFVIGKFGSVAGVGSGS